MKHGRIMVSVGLTLLALAGCTMIKQTAMDVPGVGYVVQRSAGVHVEAEPLVVLAQSDRPMRHGDYTFPVISSWGNELTVGWSTQGDATLGSWISVDEKGELLFGISIPSPAVSLDTGITWTVRAPSGLGAQMTNTAAARFYSWQLHPWLIQPFFGKTTLRDGSQLGFQKVIWAVSPDRGAPDYPGVGAGMRYENGVWSPPFDVWFDIPGLDKTAKADVMYVSPTGLQLDDGRILLLCYSKKMFPYKLEARAPGAQGYVSMLYVSDDDGHTFKPYSTVASTKDAVWAQDGPSEGSWITTGNGDWLVAMRTGGIGGGDRIKRAQPLLFARSEDQGKTWHTYSTGRSGVCPALCRLSNGIIACSFGRPGNRVMFSADDGRTWFKTVVLTSDFVPTSGYTDCMEVAPGRLLVVYDEQEYAPKGTKLWDKSQGVNAVFARYFNVERDSNEP